MTQMDINKIMEDINIQSFSIAEVGSVIGLEEVYEQRKLGDALTGLEPQGQFRASPDKFLKNGKTIIAIAIPYETINPFSSPFVDDILIKSGELSCGSGINKNDATHYHTIRGFVTNMAWEFDYHKVVNEKLEIIKQRILACYPKGKFLSAVDTGDINDRMAAYGARLGWIGRNQFLINSIHGTSFYIGILITDIELPDRLSWRTDYQMRCYSCRRCQVACPVGALSGEQDFNGQKCISTLTQLKRELTFDECVSIGMNMYGCDICQWACPYNAKSIPISEEFKRNSLNQLEPRDILTLTNKKFKKIYANTGFAWRGLSTFKRNALICMGNDRQVDDWAYIYHWMNQSDYNLPFQLFRYAIWAMFMIDYNRTISVKETMCEKFDGISDIFYEIIRWFDNIT